jgi:FkbM family methyltransferase
MRRRLIQHFLRKKGLTIAPLNGPTLSAAFERLMRRNIPVNSVLDVGASTGCWSERLLAVYPEARYLCIEAQAVHEPSLRGFKAQHRNVDYIMTAAGAAAGEIFFDATDPFGGVASYTPVEKNCIRVPVAPLDELAKRYGLQPPFLVKLDTHGFEVPILTGAARVLQGAAVLVIEAYNFKIAPEALLFPELCLYLAERGFRCLDMFDPLYRPKDEALWQMDLVFARADRPEFQYNSYE